MGFDRLEEEANEVFFSYVQFVWIRQSGGRGKQGKAKSFQKKKRGMSGSFEISVKKRE